MSWTEVWNISKNIYWVGFILLFALINILVPVVTNIIPTMCLKKGRNHSDYLTTMLTPPSPSSHRSLWSGSGLPLGHCEGKVIRKNWVKRHSIAVCLYVLADGDTHTHTLSSHDVLCRSSLKVRVQTQKQFKGIWQCSVATFSNEGVSETHWKF